ncbi:MAG: transcriptional regulator [Thermoproteota archaeon]
MEDAFELAYRYVVPSVRRTLATKLVKKGMLRKEAAEILELSRSAVSRYLNSERGMLIKTNEFKDVMNLVEKLADRIIREKPSDYIVQEETAKIVAYFMSRKYFCKTHKKMNPGIDIAKCRICERVFNAW